MSEPLFFLYQLTNFITILTRHCNIGYDKIGFHLFYLCCSGITVTDNNKVVIFTGKGYGYNLLNGNTIVSQKNLFRHLILPPKTFEKIPLIIGKVKGFLGY